MVSRAEVWVPGLVLGAALAFVIRPVVAGLCLAPVRRGRGERAFVLFAGLKGAVPILLGSFLLSAGVPGAQRLYGIVAVAVVFSVVVQGGLVPAAARLRDEPSGVRQLTVAAGSPADGRTVGELAGLPGGAWVSFIVRGGQLVPVKAGTRLQPGDDVLVLADPDLHDKLTSTFTRPSVQ